MTFNDACAECIATPGFLNEFNRLTGYKLGKNKTQLEKMIDDACGYDPDSEAMQTFVSFVYDCVWLPLINVQKKGGEAQNGE